MILISFPEPLESQAVMENMQLGLTKRDCMAEQGRKGEKNNTRSTVATKHSIEAKSAAVITIVYPGIPNPSPIKKIYIC